MGEKLSSLSRLELNCWMVLDGCLQFCKWIRSVELLLAVIARSWSTDGREMILFLCQSQHYFCVRGKWSSWDSRCVTVAIFCWCWAVLPYLHYRHPHSSGFCKGIKSVCSIWPVHVNSIEGQWNIKLLHQYPTFISLMFYMI